MTILKQAQVGTPVSGLCREHGKNSSMIARFKEFEVENVRSEIYVVELIRAKILKEAIEKVITLSSLK